MPDDKASRLDRVRSSLGPGPGAGHVPAMAAAVGAIRSEKRRVDLELRMVDTTRRVLAVESCVPARLARRLQSSQRE
jgi:hypothetical protein